MIKYGSKTATKETKEKRQLNDRKILHLDCRVKEKRKMTRDYAKVEEEEKNEEIFLFLYLINKSSTMNVQREINIQPKIKLLFGCHLLFVNIL